MSSNINFSNFSPKILRAIEATGNFCQQMGSSQIDAACLMAGLCNAFSHEIMLLVEQAGFDFNASMQNLSSRFNNRENHNTSETLTFSPEVNETFLHCATTYPIVGIQELTNSLLKISTNELICHLIQKGQTEIIAANESVKHRNPSEDDSSTGPSIKQHCCNMLKLAKDKKFRHAIGRDKELDRLFLILARSNKNNPILVGDAGTGKTAIAEEFALRLLMNQVPTALLGLKLYSLEITPIMSSPDKVNIMKKIIQEASNDHNLVIFIDEIHQIINSSTYSDNEIANLLKPALARGEIKILGATTNEEYRKIEKDSALERRFQKIIVNEPDNDSAILILQEAKRNVENHHGVIIPDEVCEATVTLSVRYIANRKLPDKALDLIDEAAAKVKIKDHARNIIVVNDIMSVITDWTGIPIDELDNNEMEKLRNLEAELKSSIVGQDKAIKSVADTIKRNRLGFGDSTRPIGSFLFLGSTGTGKTELCKAVSKSLFNDSNKMIRLDMSEYQQEHSSQRLFGAPPGYIGYEQGGQLTEAVYRNPFNIVLLDEIEKAHPKIFETLLQVLDDGRMTDGQGKVVNFKNSIIVMTSNIGQQAILDNLCGNEVTEKDIEQCTNEVMSLLKHKVAPAFLNRIDNVVMFMPLRREDINKITEILLKREQDKFSEKGITLLVDNNIVDYIVRIGYSPEYGARPIKRAITNYIINPLTSEIVSGNLDRTHPIKISISNDMVEIRN